MKIEINCCCKGIPYEALCPGDVFATLPLKDASENSIYMKPATEEEYAISLRSGVFVRFNDEEVVYPLNATLVINEE